MKKNSGNVAREEGLVRDSRASTSEKPPQISGGGRPTLVMVGSSTAPETVEASISSASTGEPKRRLAIVARQANYGAGLGYPDPSTEALWNQNPEEVLGLVKSHQYRDPGYISFFSVLAAENPSMTNQWNNLWEQKGRMPSTTEWIAAIPDPKLRKDMSDAIRGFIMHDRAPAQPSGCIPS